MPKSISNIQFNYSCIEMDYCPGFYKVYNKKLLKYNKYIYIKVYK